MKRLIIPSSLTMVVHLVENQALEGSLEIPNLEFSIIFRFPVKHWGCKYRRDDDIDGDDDDDDGDDDDDDDDDDDEDRALTLISRHPHNTYHPHHMTLIVTTRLIQHITS